MYPLPEESPRKLALFPKIGETFGLGGASIPLSRAFPRNPSGLSYLQTAVVVLHATKVGWTAGSDRRKSKLMRSDRVFDALHTLRNRYMLCQLASKATRKFHKPNTRIQETMNEVLDRIASSERQTVLSEPENFAEAQRRAA